MRCPLARALTHAGAAHAPLYASVLNQNQIYFSIVQRTTLTPNDVAALTGLEHYLPAFQHRYQVDRETVRWTFT
jgi:hypothetical protein